MQGHAKYSLFISGHFPQDNDFILTGLPYWEKFKTLFVIANSSLWMEKLERFFCSLHLGLISAVKPRGPTCVLSRKNEKRNKGERVFILLLHDWSPIAAVAACEGKCWSPDWLQRILLVARLQGVVPLKIESYREGVNKKIYLFRTCPQTGGGGDNPLYITKIVFCLFISLNTILIAKPYRRLVEKGSLYESLYPLTNLQTTYVLLYVYCTRC